MTKPVTTWMPLAAAYEHVLRHEQLDLLTAHRLRLVLTDGRVHARARYMYLPNVPRRERERTDEPLPGKFWSCDVFRGSDFDDTLEADVTWQENRASIKKHPLGDCDAYQIEVDQEELFAIWPERSASTKATKRSSVGRPPKYPEAFQKEATAYAEEYGLPEDHLKFRKIIAARLGDDAPKRKTLAKLADEFYYRYKQELDEYAEAEKRARAPN